MTGALDKVAGPVALKLIAKYGKSVSLIRVTVGAYDPATSAAATTEATSTIAALVEDFKPYELANGLATVGDKKLTVAASGLAIPALIDAVVIDGVRFAIVSIETIYSGELPCLYILHGRKS